MRDQWYGDNRDIVKWGTVWRLAAEAPSAIVHVPMLTPDEPARGSLRFNDGSGIPAPVLQHFRESCRAAQIAWPENTSFAFVSGFLMPERDRHFRRAVELVNGARASSGRRVVVVVDPDTGIEPDGGADTKHVLREELRLLWNALAAGDALAVYQHAWRDKRWERLSRARFARTIDVDDARVESLRCEELAGDVAMLVTRR